MRIFCALLFIFSDGLVYAMRTPKIKEKVELISGQPIKNKQIKTCKQRLVCCIPASCGVVAAAFLITALYAVAHPPQECSFGTLPYLNSTDNVTDISDKSFDVHIQSCGICIEEHMRCNYPIEGVKTPLQLFNRVTKHMEPICGPNATYRITANAVLETDHLAFMRQKGDSAVSFNYFVDQKESTKRSCSTRRPLSNKFKKNAR